MGNYFNIFNTGLRALQTQKKSMDTTGHNISNANTEGYSRQRAVHKTTEPYTAPGLTMPAEAGQVGTGVKVDEIKRIRDSFIDGQIWEKKQEQGYWEKRYEGLNRIEKILNEPSDTSLSSNISKFWQTLEDLSNDPTDSAVRTTVREQAQTLVDTFHSIHSQLSDYKRSLNEDVNTTVNEINSLTQRIADLNARIVHIKGSGNNPNDLMDQRDLLFEKLNEKVNVQGRIDERGNMNISLGGVGLVNGDNVNELKTQDSGTDYEDEVVFTETNNEIKITGGKLKGLINVRDQELSNDPDNDGYIYRLNQMAKTFAEEFNTVHEEGYDLNGEDGGKFFSILSNSENQAQHIGLADNVKNDINKIAAGRFEGNYSMDSEIMTAAVTDLDNVNKGYEYKVEIDESDDSYTITNLTTGNTVASGGAGSFTPGMTIDDTSNSGLEFTLKDYGTTTAVMEPGQDNGANALKLANVVKKDKIFNNDKSTMLDNFQSMVSTVGVDGRRADQMVDNTDSVLKQLENQRESISGVSLDEEMSNMIKYQQAYNAAAKLISNSNRMMDSLMSILR